MNQLFVQRTCCFIYGGGLQLVSVRGVRLAMRVTASHLVPDALAASLDSGFETFDPGEKSRIILVCPSSWCAVRPIALDAPGWSKARDDVMASIESFFPLPAEDALVGYLRSHGESSVQSEEVPESRCGYLIAASRSRLKPWIDAVERITGRVVEEVIPVHAALLGLGLQKYARAQVLDAGAHGVRTLHMLEYGRVTAIEEPWSEDAQERASLMEETFVAQLPCGTETSVPGSFPNGAAELTPADVALGGALASIVAPGEYAPMIGKRTGAPKRWLAPLAAAAVAIGVFWSAGVVVESRFASASQQIASAQQSLAVPLSEAESVRSRARALIQRIETVHAASKDWNSVLPVLFEAQGALPPDGYLYRIEIDQSRVKMAGEARSAGDVLRQIERSEVFHSAERISTAAPTPRGETFDVQAQIRRANTTGNKRP